VSFITLRLQLDHNGSPIDEESDYSLDVPRIMSKWSRDNLKIKKLTNINGIITRSHPLAFFISFL